MLSCLQMTRFRVCQLYPPQYNPQNSKAVSLRTIKGNTYTAFTQFRITIQLLPYNVIYLSKRTNCRFQWPRGLRRRSLAARLLRLWVRIPPGAWIFVYCECCVLSGRGLCDGLIIRSEESYRMWRVVVCDEETSQARRLKPTRGL